MPAHPLDNEDQRQGAVAWAATPGSSPLASQPYVHQPLARPEGFAPALPDATAESSGSTFHILYRSRATTPPTEAALQALLDHARRANAERNITGVMLYSDGRYVQVLEGAEDEVRALYGRIRRDPRHTQVVTVSQGPGSRRRFPAWRMALGHVAQPAVARLLDAVLAEEPFHSVRIDDPLLHTLLDAFGVSSPEMTS